MIKFLITVSLLVTFKAMADESKHMVTFGNNVSTGWSGSSGTAETDSDMGVDEFNIINGELNLNYGYRIGSRFQIGGYISSETSESEIKADAGGKIKSEDKSFSIYAVVSYNFSDDFSNAFYILGGIGKETHEEEAKDTTGGTTETAESEYDVTGYIFQVGKRFNLKAIGIENLTYSPAVSFHHGNVGGDLEDTGVESLSVVTIEAIKFDLLF
jgi:hypothetical protein